MSDLTELDDNVGTWERGTITSISNTNLTTSIESNGFVYYNKVIKLGILILNDCSINCTADGWYTFAKIDENVSIIRASYSAVGTGTKSAVYTRNLYINNEGIRAYLYSGDNMALIGTIPFMLS